MMKFCKMVNAVLKIPVALVSTKRAVHACRINASPVKYEWPGFAFLILINPKSLKSLKMTLSNARRERIRLLLIVQALLLMRSAWVVV